MHAYISEWNSNNQVARKTFGANKQPNRQTFNHTTLHHSSHYLFEPEVLESFLREVLSCDDTSDAVIAVEHHQMPQTHSTEEAIAALH